MVADYLLIKTSDNMPSIILIDKTGTVKSVSAKDIAEEALAKKAGFKSADGFVLQHTWGQEEGLDQHISLYAKTTGRAGQENKYDFPTPVDERLFFGTCVLVGKRADGTAVDLGEDDWEDIYEFLFGGFEDIGSEDSEEEDVDTDDELLQISKQTGTVVKQTKHGYAKDGFVVDDDEENDDYETEESSAESEESPPPRRKGRKPAALKQPAFTKKRATPATKKVTVEPPVETAVTQQDLVMEDCESELSEESYES
jgi:hypothetical protein